MQYSLKVDRFATARDTGQIVLCGNAAWLWLLQNLLLFHEAFPHRALIFLLSRHLKINSFSENPTIRLFR